MVAFSVFVEVDLELFFLYSSSVLWDGSGDAVACAVSLSWFASLRCAGGSLCVVQFVVAGF